MLILLSLSSFIHFRPYFFFLIPFFTFVSFASLFHFYRTPDFLSMRCLLAPIAPTAPTAPSHREH